MTTGRMSASDHPADEIAQARQATRRRNVVPATMRTATTIATGHEQIGRLGERE